MASVTFEGLEPLTDATLSEITSLRRITVQPLRDVWPGINQPYVEEDGDGD
jgi:hypothetical protein